MHIDQFEWDDGNIVKNLISHGVTRDEAEEIFYHPILLHKRGDRHYLYGTADAGRHLFCVFQFKHVEGTPTARVISIRDMSRMEHKRFKTAKLQAPLCRPKEGDDHEEGA